MLLQQPTQTPPEALATAPSEEANEFLTFRLGQQEYGMEILKVQEIRSWEQPTKIVNAPNFIKGEINLRGKIVPIIDMRVKFSLSDPSYDTFTVLIILNVGGRIVGIVADAVSDVLTLGPHQIRPVPDFFSTFDTQCITGLGTVDKRMLILVDIEKLVTGADRVLLA